MKYLFLFFLLSIRVFAQLPPTDKPTGVFVDAPTTTFTVPRDHIRVPASEALTRIQLTTDTVSTASRQRIILNDDGTTETTTVIVTRHTIARFPGHFIYRVNTAGNYYINPLTGRFYRPQTKAERDASGATALGY